MVPLMEWWRRRGSRTAGARGEEKYAKQGRAVNA
jgi:hypothetical protein